MASLTKYFGSTGKIIDTAAIRRKIGKALSDAAIQARNEYKKTVTTWEQSPEFTITRSGEFARIVGTENEIYGYVDHGTRPHIIRPTTATNLAFQVGYTPKTSPRVIGSQAGGNFGPVAFSVKIQHPGTDAREFSKTIANTIQPILLRKFDQAFQDAQR